MPAYSFMRWIGLFSLAALLLVPTPSTAESLIQRKTLGGYGSATLSLSLRSSPSSAYIPAGGAFGTAVSTRSLEPTTPTSSSMPRQPPRTTIGGQSRARTPIGGSSRMMGRGFPAFSSRGAMGTGSTIRSPSLGRRSIMAPRLNSPFGPPPF